MNKLLQLFNLWRWNRPRRVNDPVVDHDTVSHNLDRLLAAAYPSVQASEALRQRVAATIPPGGAKRAPIMMRRVAIAGVIVVVALCIGGTVMSIVMWTFSASTPTKPVVILEIRHWGVMSVVFSPDGKTVASGGVDKTVQLWDTRTGMLKQTLAGAQDTIYSVAFSPDGNTVAGGSGGRLSGEVRLWDVQTGRLLHTLTGPNTVVYSVVFSPDGKTVASASGDETVRLWDAQTGTLQWILRGHSNRVRSVAFSPDGKTVTSGSEDRTVRLWDAQTGTWQRTLKGHRDAVVSVVFSPDGKTLASGGVKIRFVDVTGEVKLWDAQTDELKQTLPGRVGVVYSVAFSPDGKRVASGGESGDIHRAGGEISVWDAQTGKLLWWTRLKPNRPYVMSNTVTSIAFSPDGKHLASASHDGIVRIWSLQSGGRVAGDKYTMRFSLDRIH